jgi:dephospho-CoA kinase
MQKLILGLAGEIASGKGTISQYIENEYKGSSHRFSNMLRDILDRLYLPQSREDMQKLSTIMRENFGEDIMAKVMMEDVKKDEHEVIVVDGVRRLEDIKYLRELPGFNLVYIETDMERCYDRIIKRNENTDDHSKTFEEFQKEREQESESQIKDLRNYANFVVNNDGEFRDLYKQIDEMLKK